jgi:transposase InsO family protein
VKQILDLAEQHGRKYPDHPLAARLEQARLTVSAYRRLCEGFVTQTVRESAIPEADVKAAIEFIIKYPEIGAGKIRLSLLEKELAYLSTAGINEVKQVLTEVAKQKYRQRKENEKLMEAQLHQDLLARRKASNYTHIRAKYPNHIWAIDFVTITFQGLEFALCPVYDEYSQNYLSLGVGPSADHELACRSLQEAFDRAPKKPHYLRRDNGKPFLTEPFQLKMGFILDYPVPPRSPWYNGSLESCNGSLKAAVRAIGMQYMAQNPGIYREDRKSADTALKALVNLAEGARIRLNEEIARGKHGMTPAKVYSGQARAHKDLRQTFIAKKKQQRIKRMADIRAKPARKRPLKTLAAKAQSIGKRLIGRLDTNALFVLDEILHHRFRMFEA